MPTRFTRRRLLLTASAGLIVPTAPAIVRAHSVPQHAGLHAAKEIDENGKQLGDDGFRHAWLHKHYQKYFPTTKCPCQEGECRPTTWSRSKQDPRILVVLINREWLPLGENVKIRYKKDLPNDFPAEMLSYDAHACAYGKTVTCAWILNYDV